MLSIITKSLIRQNRQDLIRRISNSYGELTYTQELTAQSEYKTVHAYRAIDLEGNLLDKSLKYDCGFLAKMLKAMIFTDEMDKILLKVKAQGKISFYMSSFGEHACIVGSAAALQPRDWLFPQYREQGAFIWRGFTIDQIINQCIGNSMDLGRGRQMPVHYGSKELNLVTVSSPLTTQVPQASGAGYAFRTANEDKVAAVYFGEGAASEGDFPTALNFAATLKAQTLFLCRNNKYAISTPSSDQYVSDGIVSRAIAYGIASTRVDGNDALAVLQATRKARKYIVQEKKPYFLEFMTYRMGDHSTSDNSTMYRKEDERAQWRQKNDPIKRLTKFLQSVNYKDIPDEKVEREQTQKIVTSSLHRCQKHKFPSVESLFEDVYDKIPQHLIEQREQLRDHLKNYGDKYSILQKFEK